MSKLNPNIPKNNFKYLFTKYYSNLVLFSNRIVTDLAIAEDIVQDVFANLWEKQKSIITNSEIKSYLYNTVKNSSLNYLRHKKVEKAYQNKTSINHNEIDIQREIIYDEVYSELRKAFNSLPPKCKKIYGLYLNNLKAKEIAEDLNIAIETVKAQKRRAKKLIKQYLKKSIKNIIMWYFSCFNLKS
jgi:RNA polymerase sigma-70 factor (ECF subfamily)